jgi:hypothetical protein
LEDTVAFPVLIIGLGEINVFSDFGGTRFVRPTLWALSATETLWDILFAFSSV